MKALRFQFQQVMFGEANPENLTLQFLRYIQSIMLFKLDLHCTPIIAQTLTQF